MSRFEQIVRWVNECLKAGDRSEFANAEIWASPLDHKVIRDGLEERGFNPDIWMLRGVPVYLCDASTVLQMRVGDLVSEFKAVIPGVPDVRARQYSDEGVRKLYGITDVKEKS